MISHPTDQQYGFSDQRLVCLGLSHHHVGVDVRERFAVPPIRVPEVLGHLLGTGVLAEGVILSTCNRVEFYAVMSGAGVPALREFLRERAGLAAAEFDPGWFYVHQGEAAARHLMQVAAGLDSMVVGETEILGQVKEAYELSRALGACGPVTHRLFQKTFQAAKHVRSATGVGRGAVSIGSVAVELAQEAIGGFAHRQVMILGAGEIGERTARALVSRGVRSVLVSNRSPERARTIAGELGGEAIGFEDWPERLGGIDILITSTAAPHIVVRPEHIHRAMAQRRGRRLFIIDLAVPRDVAPEVNAIENVYVYDIDALQSLANRATEDRATAALAAQGILENYVKRLNVGAGIRAPIIVRS